LALFQLVQPGSPVVYGTGAVQMDMASGQMRDNARGNMMRLGLAEMAKFYHLPVNMGGLGTASEHLDAQYAFDAGTTCLLSYLAGADEIYSMGLLGSAQILSFEKLVLDNHLARELELMVQALDPVDGDLGGDLIRRVGVGGHFLSQPETRSYIRREYVPVWPPVGKDMLGVARAQAGELLATHQPPPLAPAAEAEIEKIMARAEVELAS
jgi:trimethylamine--corrinoid protein Co-methyltransferase